MKKQKSSQSSLNWVIKRCKSFIPALAFTTLINIVSSLLLVALARLSKEIIDSASGSSSVQISLGAIWLFGIIIFQVILDSALSLINVRVVNKIIISIRNYMFSLVVHKKYSKVFKHHSGDMLNRFSSDIDQVASSFMNIIPSVAAMVTKIVVGIWELIAQNYILGIIVLLVGCILPMCGRFISKKYKWLHKEVMRTEGQTRSFMQECFANIVVIKTFVSELPIIKKLNDYMKENLKIRIKQTWVSVFFHACLYSMFTLGYYAVLVWGAGQIALGVITYGTLNYFLQLVSILRAPLQNVSGVFPRYYAMLASAERLMDFENIEDEPDVFKNEDLQEIKDKFEKISIKNLAFAYEEEIILKNCTFDIPKNEITAITGESGSGKSTLFKVILGLYEPTGGSITFNDDININASTRGMFSYVPQGNMILSGTIKDNITLYDDSISEERIIKATKAAVIYDFIKTLPDGFETVLSERGAGLSEGQVQRLSIARALLFDAPILLLDESTSALDEQTETQLLSNIKHMTDKTVLFITHRNTSISVCDHIIHVDGKSFNKVK